MDYDYDVIGEPMVVHKSIMDKILKRSRPADLIALYMFYYYTAKWQKTNTPKATVGYVSKGLQMGRDKLRRAKKELIDMGLVEDVMKQNNGKITGHYIKVKFIWSNPTPLENQRVGNQLKIPTPLENQRVGNQEGNALSPNSKYTMKSSTFMEPPSEPPSKPNNFRPAYYRFVKSFQQRQIKNLPSWYRQYTPKQLERQIIDGVAEIDRLVRLDKWEFSHQVKPALEWALDDPFWQKQIRSLSSLRNRSKNRDTKFSNLMVAWTEAAKISPRKASLPHASEFVIKGMFVQDNK